MRGRRKGREGNGKKTRKCHSQMRSSKAREKTEIRKKYVPSVFRTNEWGAEASEKDGKAQVRHRDGKGLATLEASAILIELAGLVNLPC